MNLGDTALFLKEAFFSPRQMGALLPSSERLATAMADYLPSDPDSHVLELGPGTGIVTRALLNSGLAPRRLVAIEKSEKLSRRLEHRFPGIHVLTGDAFALDQITSSWSRMPDAIISSLPLRNFSRSQVEDFYQSVSSVLKPGGVLVQYSYHIHREHICCMDQLQHEHSHIVWRNLPPARVYVYRNQPAPSVLQLSQVVL